MLLTGRSISFVRLLGMVRSLLNRSMKESSSQSSEDKVRKLAQALLDALQDEAANHGSLRTQKSLRLENELRLELAR